MNLHGTEYTPTDLRRRIGNMDQVAGIRLSRLEDANTRPTLAADFRTGAGFDFTVLPDRGMDIAAAHYHGKSLAWRSCTGDVAPQYFEAEGIRWLRSYFGGLVTTCGLTNVGAPAADSAVSGRGLHGRIGNIPARNLKQTQEWRDGRYLLSLEGTLREAALFCENLSLTRTVSAYLGETRFFIHDEIVNEGFDPTPFQILYHCNIGWPALDAHSRMISASARIAPRDATAADGIEAWNRMDPPTPGYAEKVYYHDMRPADDGGVAVAIVNESLDGAPFGVYIKYNKNELPRFTQWKMMGEQAYILGLEPCNCGVEGRAADEALGLLEVLEPGAKKSITLEFGVIADPQTLAGIEAACQAPAPQFVDSYKAFFNK